MIRASFVISVLPLEIHPSEKVPPSINLTRTHTHTQDVVDVVGGGGDCTLHAQAHPLSVPSTSPLDIV